MTHKLLFRTRWLQLAICTLIGLLGLNVSQVYADETIVENFETQDAGTTYTSTIDYDDEDSDIGIEWTVVNGTVSTTDAIDRTQSVNMRAYYAKSSSSSTWTTSPLPSITSTTPVTGLKSISFHAIRKNGSTLKINVEYSTNGSTWSYMKTTAATPADASAQTIGTSTTTTYTYNIPSSDANTDYYIRLSMASSSTHANKPGSSGHMRFVVDSIAFTYAAASCDESPTIGNAQINTASNNGAILCTRHFATQHAVYHVFTNE